VPFLVIAELSWYYVNLKESELAGDCLKSATPMGLHLKIIECAKRHNGTLWPSHHKKMKNLALMATEIWSGNEIYDVEWNFKMATFLGVESKRKKTDLRIFTLNLP
jgi:hypothetical protein